MTKTRTDRATFETTPPFDYTDEKLRIREAEYLAEQREQCPVIYSSHFGGFWALTKYEDVALAAHDDEHFTTTEGPTIPAFGRPYAAKPLTSDPPEHGKYRKVLHPYFTARAVAEMEPFVREIVLDKVTALVDRHEADFMVELGEPIPAEVMAVTLGFDRARGRDITRMNKKTQSSGVQGDAAATAEVRKEVLSFLTAEFEARRLNPTDDLLSAIVHCEIDGEPVPEDVRFGMANMLIVAGTDTTVSGITNTLALLAERPELHEVLAHDRSKLDAFINESLRYDAPVFGLARTVREPICMRGVELEAGERVLLLWGSGNRDADRFAEPETFDPNREEAANLTFGYGRHRCIGDHLAKLEIRVVVEEVLAHMGGFRLSTDEPLPPRLDLEHGPTTLPVVW